MSKRESFNLFRQMGDRIKDNVVKTLFHAEPGGSSAALADGYPDSAPDEDQASSAG